MYYTKDTAIMLHCETFTWQLKIEHYIHISLICLCNFRSFYDFGSDIFKELIAETIFEIIKPALGFDSMGRSLNNIVDETQLCRRILKFLKPNDCTNGKSPNIDSGKRYGLDAGYTETVHSSLVRRSGDYGSYPKPQTNKIP